MSRRTNVQNAAVSGEVVASLCLSVNDCILESAGTRLTGLACYFNAQASVYKICSIENRHLQTMLVGPRSKVNDDNRGRAAIRSTMSCCSIRLE
jgi:hypothetical protein